MTGLRSYYALVEITYLGGSLPDESHRALVGALGDAGSCTVVPGTYDTVVVNSTVRADSPVTALSQLSATLDRALLTTGLFERFDVTGKTIKAGPVERR